MRSTVSLIYMDCLILQYLQILLFWSKTGPFCLLWLLVFNEEADLTSITCLDLFGQKAKFTLFYIIGASLKSDTCPCSNLNPNKSRCSQTTWTLLQYFNQISSARKKELFEFPVEEPDFLLFSSPGFWIVKVLMSPRTSLYSPCYCNSRQSNGFSWKWNKLLFLIHVR